MGRESPDLSSKIFSEPFKNIIAAGKLHFFSDKNPYRLAGTETVLDVTLEDDSIGLSEPEGLVDTLESCALRGEPREDGGVYGAAVLVNYRESRSGVLCHGDTVPGTYNILNSFLLQKIFEQCRLFDNPDH